MEDCKCGCGYRIGSEDFIRFHVESEEEYEKRKAVEQYEAEQEAMRESYEEQNDHSAASCFCTRHWG